MDDFRVGFGYDSHRIAKGRKLILGGVEFPGEDGLLGHSDADVLIHAIIDSLLGAACEGDIGAHFPDTDEKWKGASSAMMLSSVVSRLSEKGWTVGNVDATVIAEKIRIRPQADKIRESLAQILKVDISRVSVKGKTNEKMDDVGASVGVVCHAAALIFKNNKDKNK
ncbi:MAG: 2-C-methyl-D-erythritol 2,4-cyclodiphosphate synthase [Kiritimatiellae bacterium]|nr:2-C-methyl-D-erythritol 2,4-cyclodiphosphate synthase [Kiritimatiellia bacterium]